MTYTKKNEVFAIVSKDFQLKIDFSMNLKLCHLNEYTENNNQWLSRKTTKKSVKKNFIIDCSYIIKLYCSKN